MLKSLSIITITYNDNNNLLLTYKNLRNFRQNGGTHIIVNGGNSIKHLIDRDCTLIEESDNGIYDALNKGISQVKTRYLMILHSGDTLITSTELLEDQIKILEENKLDLLLNDSIIDGKYGRNYNSKYWHPWMFNVGVQPPHLPIIYRKNSIIKYKYNTEFKVIADFDYLERLFRDKLKYSKGGNQIIRMAEGGLTTSGIESFILVSKEFVKMKGYLVGIWFIISRPLIKLIMTR